MDWAGMDWPHVVRVTVADAVMSQRPLVVAARVVVVVVPVAQGQEEGVHGGGGVPVVPLVLVVDLARPVLSLILVQTHHDMSNNSQNRTAQ